MDIQGCPWHGLWPSSIPRSKMSPATDKVAQVCNDMKSFQVMPQPACIFGVTFMLCKSQTRRKIAPTLQYIISILLFLIPSSTSTTLRFVYIYYSVCLLLLFTFTCTCILPFISWDYEPALLYTHPCFLVGSCMNDEDWCFNWIATSVIIRMKIKTCEHTLHALYSMH